MGIKLQVGSLLVIFMLAWNVSISQSNCSLTFREVCVDLTINKSMFGHQTTVFPLPQGLNVIGPVSTKAAFITAYKNLQDGDLLIVADGSYNWGTVELGAASNFNFGGTGHNNRAYVTSETPHGVTFMGTRFEVYSKWVTWSNMTIRNTEFFVYNQGQRFTHMNVIYASYQTFRIESTINSSGSDTEIDNCIFDDAQFVLVFGDDISTSQVHTSRRCWFHHNTILKSKVPGQSIITGIGYTPFHDYPVTGDPRRFHVIEWNSFDNIDMTNDDEIFSIKSPAWMVRHNYINYSSSAGMSGRMTYHTLFYDNIIAAGQRTMAQYYSDDCERSWNVVNVANCRGWRAVYEVFDSPDPPGTDNGIFHRYLPTQNARTVGNIYMQPTHWVDIITLVNIYPIGVEPNNNILKDNIYFNDMASVTYSDPKNVMPESDWNIANPEAQKSMNHFMGLPTNNCVSSPTDITIDITPETYYWDFGVFSNDTTVNVAPGPVYFESVTFTDGAGQVVVPTSCTGPSLELRIALEGSFDPSNQLMRDELRTKQVLPLIDPSGLSDNILPTTYAITGPTALVDWVKIELLDPATLSLVETISGLVRRDGKVVASDGISPLVISNTIQGDVHVLVRHQSHLPIMTATPITPVNRVYEQDFTLANSFTSNGAGQKEIIPNVWALIAGNAYTDNDINAQDNIEWSTENGNFGVYISSDFNMDADANAADKILWGINNGYFTTIPNTINTTPELIAPSPNYVLNNCTYTPTWTHTNPTSTTVNYDIRINGIDPALSVPYPATSNTFDICNILGINSGTGSFDVELLYWYDGGLPILSAGVYTVNYSL